MYVMFCSFANRIACCIACTTETAIANKLDRWQPATQVNLAFYHAETVKSVSPIGLSSIKMAILGVDTTNTAAADGLHQEWRRHRVLFCVHQMNRLNSRHG